MESIAAQPPRCATIDLRPNALCSPRQITIVHISDTHDTCYTNIPDGDILIHSGDFTNWGSVDETKRFNAFLRTLPHPNKIVVAGNHEIGYDKADIKHVQRDMFDNVTGHCYLLHDAYCDVLGLRIHGSSWNNIESMAYGASEAFRATAWNKIQSGVHVLVTHQPPFGMFDNTLHGTDAVTEGRWGCISLRRRVDELKIPLHLYGHVHENAGLNSEGNTTFSNAAMQDYRQPNVITMIVDSAAELTTREDSTFVEDDWTAIQTDVLPKPNRNVLPHDEVVTLPAHNVSLTKYQGCFTPAHEHLWRHGVCPVLTIHINSTTQPVPGPTPTFATVREASVSIQSQTKLPTPSQQFIVYRRPDGVCAIVSDYFVKEESGSLYALTVQPGPRPSPPGFNLPIPSNNDEKTYLEFAPCQDFASAFVWRERISRVNVPNSLAFAGFYVMQLCWTLDDACVLIDEVHAVGWGNTHRLTTSTTSGSNGACHWVFPYSRVETVDYSAEEAALQSAFQHAKMFPLGHIQPQVVGTVSEYNGCISLAHPQLWHYNAAPILDVDVRQDPTYSTLCLWKQLSPLPQNQQWTVLLDDVNYRGAILSELPSQGGSSSSRAVLTLRPNAASGELQLVCESFSDQRFNSMFVWNVQRLSPDAVGPGFARYSVATFTHISTGALLYAVQPANRSNFVLQARPPNQVPTGATTQWVLPTYIPKGRM